MKSLAKKSRVTLVTIGAVLIALVLSLSAVGLYFKLSKKDYTAPPAEVNPLDFSINTWDGTVSGVNFNEAYAGRGAKTKTINSASAFAHFVKEVNNGNSFANYTIYLNSNINLNGQTINSIGTFKGVFDGGHYTIMNAKINGNALFENTENATIKNVGLYNCTFSENNGAVIHKAINTNVENVFVRLGNGKLINEFISNNGEHTIKNSFVDNSSNGLINIIDTNNSTENAVTISNCYFTTGDVAINQKIGAVTEVNVIKAKNKADFAEWNYSKEYSVDAEWCDYTYLDGTDKLDFVYPLQAGFVKVYLTGSCYESVMVAGDTVVDSSNLAVAFKEADKTEEAEINLLVEKIFMEARAEVSNTNVTVNAVKDTTIVRGENNTDSMFVGSGSSKIVIGGNQDSVSAMSTRTTNVSTITLDGNREYIEANNLESGALVVSYGGQVEIKDNVVIKNNINNNEVGYGGAVLVYNSSEVANISATFENCHSTNGGGAVAIIGTEIGALGSFKNCSSEGNGGAVYLAPELPAEASASISAMHKLYGNGSNVKPMADRIDTEGDYEISEDVVFEGCGDAGADGGALYVNGNLTISGNPTFTGNLGYNGGAIFGDGDVIILGDALFTENTANSEGGAIYCDENVEISGDATFTSNTARSNGGAIYSCGDLTISGDPTFDENSAETDGGAIYASGGDITITGSATFDENCTGMLGGAIYSYGAVTISGKSVFKSNYTGEFGNSNDFGGAIYAASIVLSGDSTFSSNYANYDGGAICATEQVNISGNPIFTGNLVSYYNNGGGAIYAPYVHISGNPTFDGNVAETDGGAIYATGDVEISGDATFTSNTASPNGGAIYSTGKVSITGNSTFENNSSGSGGAIYAKNVIISGGATFDGNTASGDGGAIYASGSVVLGGLPNGYTQVEYLQSTGTQYIVLPTTYSSSNTYIVNYDMSMDSSSSYTGSGWNAGGWAGQYVTNYWTDGTTNTTISANERTKIKIDIGSGTTTTTFTTDTATETISRANTSLATYAGTTGYPLFCLTNDTAKVPSCSMSGKIYSFSLQQNNVLVHYLVPCYRNSDKTAGMFDLVSGEFYTNIGTGSFTYGNIISTKQSEISFTNNTATGNGGAIYCDGSLTISGSPTFTSNTAQSSGGAIYCIEDVVGKGIVTISGDASFTNNIATDTGGAIYACGASSTITVSGAATFSSNSAGSGGAIYLSSDPATESPVIISGNAIFTNNTATTGSGGAIQHGDCSVIIEGDAIFTNNTAATDGGAVCSGYYGSVTISGDCTFSNNTATNGGAVYSAGDVTISGDSLFIENSVGGSGGAIYTSSGAININADVNVKFILNTSSGSGGAIYTESGDVKVSGDVTFTENTASNCGGAISIGSIGTLSINGNTIFNSNEATSEMGGAVIADTVKISGDATFINNTAGMSAGAVYSAGDVTISGNSTFTNNEANSNGGAIDAGSLTISSNTNVVFENNVGTKGEIYCSGTLTLGADIVVKTTSDIPAICIPSSSYISVTAQLTKRIRVYKDSPAIFTGSNTASYIFEDATTEGLTSVSGTFPFYVVNAPTGAGVLYTPKDETSADGKTGYGVLSANAPKDATIAPSSKSLDESTGTSSSFTYTVDTAGTMKITSSNESITKIVTYASVVSAGTTYTCEYETLDVGTAEILMEFTPASSTAMATNEVVYVNVQQRETTVTIEDFASTMTYANTQTITYSASATGTFKFTSLNPAVATVEYSKVVAALNEYSATIKATGAGTVDILVEFTPDDDYYESQSQTLSLTVNKATLSAPTNITLSAREDGAKTILSWDPVEMDGINVSYEIWGGTSIEPLFTTKSTSVDMYDYLFEFESRPDCYTCNVYVAAISDNTTNCNSSPTDGDAWHDYEISYQLMYLYGVTGVDWINSFLVNGYACEIKSNGMFVLAEGQTVDIEIKLTNDYIIDGYTFDQWDYAYEECIGDIYSAKTTLSWTDDLLLRSSPELTPSIKPIKYNVTIEYNDAYGTVTSASFSEKKDATISIDGSKLTIGETFINATPVDSTAEYSYEFASWSGLTGVNKLTRDLTIVANFKRVTNNYTINFAVDSTNKYGTVDVSSITVPYGTRVEIDENVITMGTTKITATPRVNANGNKYSFTHWTGVISVVNGSTTLTAHFTSEILYHNVTFTVNNSDYGLLTESATTSAEVVKTFNYGYDILLNDANLSGDEFSLTATPTTATAEYAYTFVGWFIDGVQLTADYTVTSDVTIEARFERTLNEYTITIRANNSAYGTVSKTSFTVAYGTKISKTANILMVGSSYVLATPAETTAQYVYEFSSWTGVVSKVTEDLTITANFTQTGREYVITISATDGGSVDVTSITVAYGTSIFVKDNTLTINGKVITATANDGYKFVEWSGVVGTVNGNITITAVFGSATTTVSFSVATTGGGTISASSVDVAVGTAITVNGETLTIGTETITATANDGYKFVEWQNVPETVTEDMNIQAVFEEDVPSTCTVTFNLYSDVGIFIETKTYSVEQGTKLTFYYVEFCIGDTYYSPNVSVIKDLECVMGDESVTLKNEISIQIIDNIEITLTAVMNP